MVRLRRGLTAAEDPDLSPLEVLRSRDSVLVGKLSSPLTEIQRKELNYLSNSKICHHVSGSMGETKKLLCKCWKKLGNVLTVLSAF